MKLASVLLADNQPTDHRDKHRNTDRKGAHRKRLPYPVLRVVPLLRLFLVLHWAFVVLRSTGSRAALKQVWRSSAKLH
jgi:hypothetical protein